MLYFCLFLSVLSYLVYVVMFDILCFNCAVGRQMLMRLMLSYISLLFLILLFFIHLSPFVLDDLVNAVVFT